MNRTRLLMIGFVALALGAFVSYVVYHNLQAHVASGEQPGVEVIVAANDIPVGARLEEKDLKTALIPESDVPPNSFHDTSKIVGRGVVLPIAKGDFVLRSKLAGERAGSGLAALIPPGMRAVSVRVNDVMSVAGFVQPGSRVDVLVTGAAVGQSEDETRTVLQNVAVIAAGKNLERSSTGEAQSSPVITLLVSPDDAQRLAMASSEGHIQLALRNPLDTEQSDSGTTSFSAVFGKLAALSTPPAPAVHHAAVRHKVAPPPPPPSYQIEIYKGEKKETKTFEGQD
jgi:pilus assembly protein CpaB